MVVKSPRPRLVSAKRNGGWVRAYTALMLIGFLMVSLLPERVSAFDSDLDPGFGQGGLVTTDLLRGGEDRASGVVVQPDQKIVVAGQNTGNMAIARYNPDGSLDSSFGEGGKLLAVFGDDVSAAQAVALQSDGKIIIAGFARRTPQLADFALVRYNSNGSLDSSFGGTGMLRTAFGTDSSGASALAIQPDGKIIAAGGVSNSVTLNDFALARYNIDGTLDSSFDGDGRVTTDLNNGQNENISGIALQSDGRIVAAGTLQAGGFTFAVARYNFDGSLDTSFGAGGKVFAGSRAVATGVAIQPDGRIVVVGFSDLNFFEFVLVRFNSDGSLDGSFGSGGIVTTDSGDFEAARAVTLQSDGKIVVAGSNGIFILLARYNSNGSPDTSFGGTGLIGIRFSDNFGSDGFGVALQSDGRVVAVGLSRTQFLGSQFAIARVDVNGNPDTSFDGDGKVTTDFPGGGDLCNALVIQPDGKIVVAGGNGGDFALARYNSDGTLDTSFGDQGKVLTDFLGGSDLAQSVALQADNKIVVAGTVTATDIRHSDFGVARYNTNGSLDKSFSGGKVITDFGGQMDEARGVAVQVDGKIVVAGASDNNRFALARYNSNGSLDTSFNGSGEVLTQLGNSCFAYSVVIQPADGKIVAAGVADGKFALARYNLNGSLDPSFDGDGEVFTSFVGQSEARAIALQSDGKIVAAGFAQPMSSQGIFSGDFAVARYNFNGSLDNSFDGDGTVTTNTSSVGDDDRANGAAIQPDGKIVLVGYTQNTAGTNKPHSFALVRYLPNGSLDNSIGNGGIVTTDVGNFPSALDQASAVAIQPADAKIVVAGQANNVRTSLDFALARYGGGDTTPPTIVCPANLLAVTSRPRDVCATVNYPAPVVGDNLPGATFVCAPPSGSCFPVGTTTVSCTATDAAGNTASCGFTITVFDVVLQSDSDHNVQLLINSFTGDYSFCCPQLPPGQSPLRSRGQMLVKGSTFTLTHNAPTYRLQATIDAAAGKGSASFKPLSGLLLCPIQDRNIYDNVPLRCGNPTP